MRSISDTISRMAAFNERSRLSSKSTRSDASALNVLSNFGTNPGDLAAKVYLPENLQKNAPLVVVLHGCTQTASAYDQHSGWSQLATEAGFALLYPEQRRSNNPNLCFNWFEPSDFSRGSGEALSIRQMIEAVVTAHSLDRKRIFITGLSAGGAMAAAMLASYPEVFSGGGIIAGLPFGSASTIPQAFDRMRGHGGPTDKDLQNLLRDASDHRGPWPSVSIWQGTDDRTVAASNAKAIASQWWGVHQIASAPTRSGTEGRNKFSVWCDDSGKAVLEVNMIAGMGHGTPIDSKVLGSPGAYMLDVEVSSTLSLARLWKIADMNNETSQPRTLGGSDSFGEGRPEAEVDTRANGVQAVIERALRSAGLMR